MEQNRWWRMFGKSALQVSRRLWTVATSRVPTSCNRRPQYQARYQCIHAKLGGASLCEVPTSALHSGCSAHHLIEVLQWLVAHTANAL